MIVGNKIERIDIPHEPGNVISIRELSGLELDDAMDITTTKGLRRMGFIGAEAVQAIRSSASEIDAQVPDPKTQYDWEYLAVHGITGWEGPNYTDVPCDTEHKKQLDRTTLEWIVGVLLERNLSQTPRLETSKVSWNGDSSPKSLRQSTK